jgi:hypothetical protein
MARPLTTPKSRLVTGSISTTENARKKLKEEDTVSQYKRIDSKSDSTNNVEEKLCLGKVLLQAQGSKRMKYVESIESVETTANLSKCLATEKPSE